MVSAMNASELLPRTETVTAAGRTLRRAVAAAGRGLLETVATGHDEAPLVLRRLSLGRLGLLAGLVALSLLVLVPTGNPWINHSAWWLVPLALTVLLLLLATRRPLLAWRLAWLLVAYELARAYLEHELPFPPLIISEVELVALAAILFVAAASQPLRVAGWVWLFTAGVAVMVPVTALLQQWRYPSQIPWGGAGWLFENVPGVVDVSRPGFVPYHLTGVALVTLVVVAGQLVRWRARSRQELVAAQESGQVLAERARIARELHDVVAHHLSLIAVRAETAPYRLESLASATLEEFAQLSRDSREALTEMRRLLGVLRSEDSPAPTAPQPSLTELADLVEPVRAAGTSVRVEMSGGMSGLPPAVDVCGYRIVQEALTNARRHAAGAPISVALRRTATELVVVVRNDPTEDRRPPKRPAGGGHGLRGMRERVAMLGGTLRAGSTDAGGYEVSAVLPLALVAG